MTINGAWMSSSSSSRGHWLFIIFHENPELALEFVWWVVEQNLLLPFPFQQFFLIQIIDYAPNWEFNLTANSNPTLLKLSFSLYSTKIPIQVILIIIWEDRNGFRLILWLNSLIIITFFSQITMIILRKNASRSSYTSQMSKLRTKRRHKA